MKKQVLIIATALATLAGCTSNLEPVPEPQGEGIFATIEQPALPFQTKTLNWDNNALKFTWGLGENVVVFEGKVIEESQMPHFFAPLHLEKPLPNSKARDSNLWTA